MKSINYEYTNLQELDSFIKEHEIKNGPNLLVQVFCGIVEIGYLQSLLSDLNSVLDKSYIMGATTDGAINGAEVSIKNTIISFTIFDKTLIKSNLITLEQLGNSSFDTGEALAFSLVQSDTRALITFATGLDTNGEEYLKGIGKITGDIVVAGGLAGDNGEFKKTFVFDNNTITSNGAVAVSLQNKDLQVNTGYSFNWMSIGKELVNGNVQVYDRKSTEKIAVNVEEIFNKIMGLI